MRTVSQNRLNYRWKLTICTLAPGQIVTKDFIRESLRHRQLEGFGDLLCPHATFINGYLMNPFKRHHCVCFRDPFAADVRCHEHETVTKASCCACQRPNLNVVGKFMSSCCTPKLHMVECHMCTARYGWSLEGHRLMLTSWRDIPSPSISRVARDERVAHLKPGYLQLSFWLSGVDPETFQGNKVSRDYFLCK